MKRKIDILLSEYGESHQNKTNKLIHWFCVPMIMFSLFGLLYSIPFIGIRSWAANWASVFYIGALLYYIRLSFSMFVGFVITGSIILWTVHKSFIMFESNAGTLALFSLAIFVVAWVAQFIGHGIEGKKPSFLKDVQFILVGPAWLLHFIFEKTGIKY